MFLNNVTDRGLISKIYKQHMNSVSERSNNPIKKWNKDLNRHFCKEYIQMAKKYM